MDDEKKGREVEFSELLGRHVLDAVDFTTAKVQKYSDYFEGAEMMAFRIDGKCYVSCENPGDGYRSSMEYLRESTEPMRNVFPACEVIGRHRTKGEYGQLDDVLEFLDATNGQIVLEVGTKNHDDYYPSFIASFQPENMAQNQNNIEAK